jgi:MerR family transcriptional regulator, copper efflux regulator
VEQATSYSISEAAEVLNLSTKTIRRYVKAGKLPSIKVQTKFGEEYRITEIPEALKEEAAAIAAAEAKTDIIPAGEEENRLDAQSLYQDNLRMAAQLGATTAQLSAANERVKALEEQLRLLESPHMEKELEAARQRIGQLEAQISHIEAQKQASSRAVQDRPWWKRLLGRKT